MRDKLTLLMSKYGSDTLEFDPDEVKHYGVMGMKWGVRKDRRGRVKARATLNRKDRKDNKWMGNVNSDSFNSTYSKVYKKAARKIRGAIRRINKSDEFKDLDFTKPSKIRDSYYDAISNAIEDQLNAASTIKGQSPNRRYEMRFEYDISKSSTPEAKIRQVDTRKGRKVQRQEARDIRSYRNLEHSDLGDGWEIFPMVFDSMGYADIPDELVEHSEDLDENFLAHYGVMGMKWGIRKDARRSSSSNKEDRTQRRARKARERTEKRLASRKLKEARKEASKARSEATTSTGNRASKLTDEELINAINRLSREKQYNQLMRELNAKPAKNDRTVGKIIREASKDAAKKAVTDVGAAYMKKYLNVQLDKALPQAYRIGDRFSGKDK